jgi:hypothetical protein
MNRALNEADSEPRRTPVTPQGRRRTQMKMKEEERRVTSAPGVSVTRPRETW